MEVPLTASSVYVDTVCTASPHCQDGVSGGASLKEDIVESSPPHRLGFVTK